MMMFNYYYTLLKNFRFLSYWAISLLSLLPRPAAMAQEQAEARGMTAEEYKMAREVTVSDLDNDTYVKINDGSYVLDRYDMKPPYFITGDSGVKKRIDLYTLVERASMNEVGLVAFFTNTETKSTFNLVIPNLMAGAEVWNMYFDDIHEHDREEKDVALKMSYILSKEVAYLMQKNKGVDVSAMQQTNSAYDFCFPATALVTLSDGTHKPIAEVKVGDAVAAFRQGKLTTATIEQISVHKKEHIPLAKVLLFPEETVTAAHRGNYHAAVMELVATPNHPVLTENGKKAVGTLQAGDTLLHFNAMTGEFEKYQVFAISNNFDTTSEVYNLTTYQGNYLINDVVVLEK